MEADSTTYENNSKSPVNEISLPFNTSPGNLNLFKQLTSSDGTRTLESHLIEKLQSFGLLPSNVTCPTNGTDCNVISKSARVIDRVQWVCEGCSRRQPIRTGSFFLRLQCSILQTLQLILAWCEDADVTVAAQYFDVKPRVATSIYDKLDALAISELKKTKLGGDNAVVLSEIYPDCLNRLSPDTTDQPHVHRILMVADTKHIPTHYRLHVIRDDLRKPRSDHDQLLRDEIDQVLRSETDAQSMLVMGNNVPIDGTVPLQHLMTHCDVDMQHFHEIDHVLRSETYAQSMLVMGNNVPIDGTVPLQHLMTHCDVDMQHFLTSRIWSQALSLCSASRELCAGAPPSACAAAVQRYLDAALYRLRHGDGFYEHVLRTIADEFTQSA